MLLLLNFFLASSLAVSPQVREGDWSSTGILYTATNPKYHLVCEFHGTRVATPTGHIADSISSVVIRDQNSGEAVTYDPPRHKWPPNFYFHDVWSPDNEWLVLSLGLYDGFQLIKAKDALAELKKTTPKEFLLLTGRKSSDGLSHRFLGWQSPASFNFDVNVLLNATSTYHFDLLTFKLSAMFDGEGLADTYTTSEGKHAIPVDPAFATPRSRAQKK